MNVIEIEIFEVLLIELKVFGDECGFFMESFNQCNFFEKIGVNLEFV